MERPVARGARRAVPAQCGEVLVPVDSRGREQVLCCAWDTEALRSALATLGDPRGRAVRDLIGAADATRWQVDAVSSSLLADIDTPADLELAQGLGDRPRLTHQTGRRPAEDERGAPSHGRVDRGTAGGPRYRGLRRRRGDPRRGPGRRARRRSARGARHDLPPRACGGGRDRPRRGTAPGRGAGRWLAHGDGRHDRAPADASDRRRVRAVAASARACRPHPDRPGRRRTPGCRPGRAASPSR